MVDATDAAVDPSDPKTSPKPMINHIMVVVACVVACVVVADSVGAVDVVDPAVDAMNPCSCPLGDLYVDITVSINTCKESKSGWSSSISIAPRSRSRFPSGSF